MKTKTWNVEAGRLITKNGEPAFSVHRHREEVTGKAALTPVEADELTHKIAGLLNGPTDVGEFVDRLSALIDVAAGSDVLPCRESTSCFRKLDGVDAHRKLRLWFAPDFLKSKNAAKLCPSCLALWFLQVARNVVEGRV